MKIVIPLAGKDENFESKGMVKPLTKIGGKEIIKLISESRPFSYEKAIFIILREHQEKYNLENELKRLFGEGIKVIISEQMTKGSPQSILLVKDLINNDNELIIDLGDQYLDLNGLVEFIEKNKENFDGLIPSFESYYWNQGYMVIGEDGLIKRVSEKDKNPISTHSTACISYFQKGSDFVKYAEQMIIKKRFAANGAYLPSLVYTEMIEDGKKIITYPCELISNLGKI